MKKLVTLALSAILVLSSAAVITADQATARNYGVKLNGKEVPVNTFVINDYSYLSLRDVSKITGKYVFYDDYAKAIYLLDDGEYNAVAVGQHGWVQKVELTIKSGDVVGAVYNEYKPYGKLDDVNGYRTNFASRAGADKIAIFDELSDMLVEMQDTEGLVDAVTSVTPGFNSDDLFLELAIEAIELAKAKDFANGVYDPSGDIDNRGYFPMIEVTYKDGKIVDVHYDEYTTFVGTGYEENYDRVKPADEAYVAAFKSRFPNIDLAKNYAAWAKDFVAADDIGAMTLTDTSDAVTGSTHSYHAFLELVAQAFSAGQQYVNGKYEAESAEFDHGYKYKVTFTVASGKITDVVFDGYSEDGVAKTSPESGYDKNYEPFAGTTIGAQYKIMTDALVDTQTLAGVDKVTGATSSWVEFKSLVKEALENGPVQ